jgi:hypothetical protein
MGAVHGRGRTGAGLVMNGCRRWNGGRAHRLSARLPPQLRNFRRLCSGLGFPAGDRQQHFPLAIDLSFSSASLRLLRPGSLGRLCLVFAASTSAARLWRNASNRSDTPRGGASTLRSAPADHPAFSSAFRAPPARSGRRTSSDRTEPLWFLGYVPRSRIYERTGVGMASPRASLRCRSHPGIIARHARDRSRRRLRRSAVFS